MADDTPKTLPADFFEKKAKPAGTPQTLPADFFAPEQKQDTTPPVQAQPPAQPEKTIERHRMVPGPGGGFPQDYRMTEGQAKKSQNLMLETLGGAVGAEGGAAITVGSKLPWLLQLLARASSTGIGTGAGTLVGEPTKPKEALKKAATTTMGAAALEGTGTAVAKVGGAVLSKTPALAKINKLLGVGAEEVIPGKTPATLDEFAANPARGAAKYGLDEKALSKLNPLERNQAVMAARDKAGKALDQVLQQAGDKPVNVQAVVKDVFGQITDKNVAAKVQDKLLDIVARAGINKPLSRLTPMEARTIQRGLDKFADFAPTDTVESMKQAATALRRGISEATRKAVPESAQFDQDYTDLYHASQGTQKLVKEYATTVPENKLRKYLIRAALGGGAAGMGYEASRLLSKATPVP